MAESRLQNGNKETEQKGWGGERLEIQSVVESLPGMPASMPSS